MPKKRTQTTLSLILLFLLLLGVKGQQCLDVDATDIYGNTNVVIDCDYNIDENVCIDLRVDYTTVASTDSYLVEPIAYAPEIPFSQGTALTPSLPQVNNLIDDKFSDAIPLGFSFCFYNQKFTEIVIGTNGILTFDLNEANADCPSGISGTNPNPALIDNAIFAIQHDMIFDLTDDSEIYYSTIGSAPCRKFVVNYYNADIFGCPTHSTIQVVLSELTNEIEVHILERQPHCPNGRDANSLLGIMNNDGTEGISPPNRNTSEWNTTNESWKFTPNGNIPPTIIWFDDQENEVGRGEQVSLCPNRNINYTAQVQYQSCIGNDLYGESSVNVTFASEFPAVENESIFICDRGNDGIENIILRDYNDFISLNTTTPFNFSYYNSLANAQDQNNEITTLNLVGDTSVFVRIENIRNPSCFTITEITFSFDAAQIDNLEITLCDNNNDGSESDVDLISYMNQILNNVTYISYEIFASEADANAQQNPITTANINTNSNFWLHLNISNDCQQVIGPINVNFLNAPPNRNTNTVTFAACDVNFNHMEPFDWAIEIPQIMNISPNETFTVHTSLQNAEDGIGNQTQISDSYTVYYVRVENDEGCYTIIDVPVNVQFTGVEVRPESEIFCFDGTEDITVNLENYLEGMLIDPLTGVDISLYDNNDDAQAHVLDNIINPIQTITEDGYSVLTSFYARFQISEECYTVRPINIRLVHPIPMQNPIDVCDIYNDDIEENNLNIYDELILGDQNGNVSYFLNQTDAENNQNQIISYEFREEVTLFVKIESYGCSEIYPINFQLASTPQTENLDIYLGQVCDTNGNGETDINLTTFENQIYTGSNATFSYFNDYNELSEVLSNPIEVPEFFSISNTSTIYVQVIDGSNSCYAVSKIILTVDFSDTFEISTSELYACDFADDLNEVFTLHDATPQIIANLNEFNPDIFSFSYYTSQEDAENNENPITGGTFTPNSTEYPIYVKLTNNVTNCSAINTLMLYTVSPPKPVNGDQGVCDNNINGLYDLDLNTLAPIVMEGDTEGYTFSYHLSENDAEQEINLLNSTEIYEAEPFPTRIWVRVENIEDCYDTKHVNISFNPLTLITDHNLYQYSCDENNDGFSNFNLTFVEEHFPQSQYTLEYFETLEQINNFEPAIADPTNYINTVANQQTVVVKISEFGSCPTYAEIELDVIPTPQVSLEPAKFCPGETTDLYPQELVPNINYSYEWLNPENEIISTEMNLLNIGIEGTYTLNVTDEDYPRCVKSISVDVTPYNPPVILDIVEDGNDVTVIATGDYAIEYSIDGENWQGINRFTNLEPGVHTFWVRYITEGCLGEPQRGIIFNIHNIITPNNDGYNDEIRIDNLDVFNGEFCTLQIYDRYGKLLFEEISNTSIVWNGTFLGRTLNSTDYWYIFKTPDNRTIKGNITLKNY